MPRAKQASIAKCQPPIANSLLLLALLLLLLSTAALSQSVRKPVFLWMDAHANIARLSTADSIRRVMDLAKGIGVTDIVVDVKPIDGFLAYPSRLAPHLTEWNGGQRSPAFPYVETMIMEARARGMKAHLSLNVFAEAHKVAKKGRAYEDSTVRSWVMTVYSMQGLQPIIDSEEEIAVFVNPALHAVRQHELSVIEEAARLFRPDGIILDRCRYTGIRSDFSDSSRMAFETHIGRTLEHWPYDVLTLTVLADGSTDYIRGPYFKDWIAWRASVIASFFREARARVKGIDAKILFGDYVGAWYPPYFEVGVNWASRRYDPSAEYDWASPSYQNTGYADDLDFLMAGTYFYEVDIAELARQSTPTAGRNEAAMKKTKEPWYSVEGSARLAKKVTMNVVPLYGSLYVEQYKERNDPIQFARAIKKVLQETDGLMIFDLVHIDRYGWWNIIGESLRN